MPETIDQETLLLGERLLQDYQNNPISFMCEILDVNVDNVWSKMQEIAECVRDNQFVAVKAGHGVSKTYTMARLALWFLLTHYPATVITTAPTYNQVEEILWREIRDSYNNAKVPLGGSLTHTKLELGDKWFALGLSTRIDTVTSEATRFQGFHNENMMVIFDEAAGVMREIWRAAQHLLTAGNFRFVAIGNPVEQFGEFAECFKDPKFTKVTISVKDTQNFKEGKEIIPGVSGRDYEERIRLQYGEDSDQYRIRILGEPPTQSMGAIYGREIAEILKFGRFCNVPYDSSYPVYTFSDLGIDDPTAIWFMQFIGKEIRWIDYYEANNEPLAHYWKVIQGKPYAYAKHYLPFDAGARSLQTGINTAEQARQLGWKCEVQPRVDVLPGIDFVRAVLGQSWFDAVKCKVGFEALQAYRWVKNERMSTEDHPVYHDEPAHDWTSHACLVAGTIIATPQGGKPIEQIRTGDYVITPFGDSKVINAGLSKYADRLIILTDSTGATITCTPEHKIFTNNYLVNADALRYSDVLIGNSIKEKLIWNIRKKLSLMDSSMGFRMAITNGLGQQRFIRQFGNYIMAQCQKVILYITETLIPLIMTYPILNCLRKKNIRFCTVGDSDGMAAKKISGNFVKQERRQVNGTEAKKARTSIKHLGNLDGGEDIIWAECLKNVSFVITNTRPISLQEANTVPLTVKQERCGQVRRIMNNGFARFVRGLFGLINTKKQKRAVRIVRINLTNNTLPVFDLTVENNHCYYANGILVSNSDAMRYASYVLQLHKESLYRPRQFEYPAEHKKPMVARNLIYAR